MVSPEMLRVEKSEWVTKFQRFSAHLAKKGRILKKGTEN